MQLTRSFEYLWTVRDTTNPSVVLHRNTSRDDARVWRDNNQTTNGTRKLYRQSVALGTAEIYGR